MGATWSQFFPPTPTLTETTLPSQVGKVFIITGGASGIGFELANILYHAGGKVYIAGRSESNARRAIELIQSSSPSIASSVGQLEFLQLELDDLSTIRASANVFKSKESKLDVLWNNAGVSLPPVGSTSKQGHELQLATNCLGPYLFTQLLLPCLREAATTSSAGAVRVVWTSSQTVDLSAPKGGFTMDQITAPPADKTANYVASKTGNWFLASELASTVEAHGILSVVQNPGNLKTQLLRHAPRMMTTMAAPLLYEARMGAYTELWAGLAPELSREEEKMRACAGYVVPWGRLHPAPRKDLLLALQSKENGGSGRAVEFREWCEEKTRDYA